MPSQMPPAVTTTSTPSKLSSSQKYSFFPTIWLCTNDICIHMALFFNFYIYSILNLQKYSILDLKENCFLLCLNIFVCEYRVSARFSGRGSSSRCDSSRYSGGRSFLKGSSVEVGREGISGSNRARMGEVIFTNRQLLYKPHNKIMMTEI